MSFFSSHTDWAKERLAVREVASMYCCVVFSSTQVPLARTARSMNISTRRAFTTSASGAEGKKQWWRYEKCYADCFSKLKAMVRLPETLGRAGKGKEECRFRLRKRRSLSSDKALLICRLCCSPVCRPVPLQRSGMLHGMCSYPHTTVAIDVERTNDDEWPAAWW